MLTHLKNTLDGYFNSSSVHGFQYIKSGNHWLSKLIWVNHIYRNCTLRNICDITFFQLIFIGIGYYLAANIVKSAIDDWSKNPVITSLDSIATPIEDVQFPTVTVCNNKWNEVQDNWAFLESLLNFIDFLLKGL